MASPEQIPRPSPEKLPERDPQAIDIEDVEQAQEFLTGEVEKGNYPVVSVPAEYADAAQKGLEPHTSWVQQARIRAKIGKPYIPEGQRRRCFRIRKAVDSFRPERTGPDRHFHGVVTVIGPVSGQELEEVPC